MDLSGLPEYGGYTPAVREVPNGDGNVDVGKRYLHVALKHDPPEWAVRHLARAHWEACRVAEALRVPDAFYPRVENGTLRVLEYPIGAGSAEHTDFDLFTLNLWRSTPEDHEQHEFGPVWTRGARAHHIGEIGELVGLGPATPHRVPARPYAQRAIVYFAMPAGAARLPLRALPDAVEPHERNRPTVSEWVAERIARSRVYT